MKFITDKEQIKAGLIIFRRGDVEHDQFYCRVRIQNEDRYKTISLKTSDRQHYGHVNTIKHADRVLMGIGGWDAMHTEMDAEIDKREATAKAAQSIKAKQPTGPRNGKKT